MTDLFDATCGTCESFHGPGEGEAWGTCWRYPPVPVSIPVQPPQNAIARPVGGQGGQGGVTGGVMTFPVRPPVQGDTLACGEYDDGSGGNLIEEVEPASDTA